MGILRLLVPDEIVCNRRIMSTLHMIRFDSMPWPGRIETDKNLVSVHRIVNHSGQVCIAYPVAGFGELTLRTGTLPERPAAYSLPVELARGTCDRLRTQLGGWAEGGLQIPLRIPALADQAVEALMNAVMIDSDFPRQSALAHESIELALRGIYELCHIFAMRMGELRRQDRSQRTRLGIRVSSDAMPPKVLERLGPDFQFVCITDCAATGKNAETPADSVANELQVQAALDGRQIMCGPVWDTGKTGLPDEINQITQFDAKRAAARGHFVRALNKIQGQPNWLYAASGLNGIGHKFLSYPQQIQLVVDLLQIVEEFNRQIPSIISFDFPWSERLAWSVGGSQAMQIADILLRQDVRISGLGLEINLDYWPQGSLPRDPLQWLELIDTWAQFGLPLFLFLRTANGRDVIDIAAAESASGIRGSFSDEQQESYLRSVFEICLSRPFVHSLVWNEAQDDHQGSYRLAGLFDERGDIKPIARLLSSVLRSMTDPGS